jgi:REP element-mobilizing transposase RayT
MTRSRYRFFESEYPYFMTCTINSWLPIFTRQESADISFDSWRHLQKERGLKLFAYVILENHLHMIASAPEISAVMQSFKSYTARQIIDLLKSRGSETLFAAVGVGFEIAQCLAARRVFNSEHDVKMIGHDRDSLKSPATKPAGLLGLSQNNY